MKKIIVALAVLLLLSSLAEAGGYFRGRGFGYGYVPAAAVYVVPAPLYYYAAPAPSLLQAPAPPCNCASALAAPTAVTQQQEVVVAPPPAVTYQRQATYTETTANLAEPACAPPPQALLRSATATSYLAAPGAVFARGVSYSHSYGSSAFGLNRGVTLGQLARSVGHSYLAASRAVFAPVAPKAVVVNAPVYAPKLVRAPEVVIPPAQINVTQVRRGLFGRVRSVTNVNVVR